MNLNEGGNVFKTEPEKELIASLFCFKRTFKILMSFSAMKSKVFAVSKVISASAILPSYDKQYNFFFRLLSDLQGFDVICTTFVKKEKAVDLNPEISLKEKYIRLQFPWLSFLPTFRTLVSRSHACFKR